MTKKGLRTFDARAAVVRLDVVGPPGPSAAPDGADAPPAGSGAGSDEVCAILEVVLRHGTPAVRPDDVLAGIRDLAGLRTAAAPLHERLAQGPLDERTGTVGDPLALNRDTA
jgi:hypothetical protein